MTATLVLVELADGNYLPVPEDAARSTFPGVEGNPRAFPAPYLDADEFLAEMTCAECGTAREDLAACERCSVRGCACLVEQRAYDCGDPADGQTLCHGCAPNHAGCPVCDR